MMHLASVAGVLVLPVSSQAPGIPNAFSCTIQRTIPGVGNGQQMVTIQGGNAWRDGAEINQYGQLGSVWTMNRCDTGKTYTFASATSCVIGKTASGGPQGADCPCPGVVDQQTGSVSCAAFDLAMGFGPFASYKSSGTCQAPGSSGSCDEYEYSLSAMGITNVFTWGVDSAAQIPKYAKLSTTNQFGTLTAVATFTDWNTDMSLCTETGIPCYDMHPPSLCVNPRPSPSPSPRPTPSPTPSGDCAKETESCDADHSSCCDGLKCKSSGGKHVCTKKSALLRNQTQVAIASENTKRLQDALQSLRSDVLAKHGTYPGSPSIFF